MKPAAIICSALILSGCMVGPDYHRPLAEMPAAYKEAPGWMPARPADGVAKTPWWTVYGDSDLDRLEPLVVLSNQTLAADYDAYEQSEALVAEARGALFPTIGLTGGATRQSGSSGSGGFSTGPRTGGDFEGTASWTPDIWGKIRRQVQSQAAAAQVTAADLANATLSAQASLASDYVQLRIADAEIALLNQTVTAYQRSLQITENQANAGVASPLDVVTARTQLEGAEAQLINTGVVRAQLEHAIAVLAGHAPADLSLPAGGLMTSVPEAPAGVPSALLQRRPDIAAAERTMAEANENIGVAVGAFYPDLTLSAVGGFSADPIDGLFSISNALWSLGSSATGTLFEGGARSAAVAAAAFSYDQTVALYRQTVLTAFQQVEDNLAALRILAQQAVVEQAAVADAGRAVQIAINEYEAGTQAYTTVVTAQVTLLSDQQTALTVQEDRLLASISLIQALGGGWTAADLPGS